MRLSFLSCLVFVSALAGCGDSGLSSSTSCGDHLDSPSCTADSACAVFSCQQCNGKASFSCLTHAQASVIECPAIDCPVACTSLTDQASCDSNPACESASCPDCKGGSSFKGCYDKGSGPAIVCPLLCPAPDCSTITDEGTCKSSASCHPTYLDEKFAHCAQGANSQCSPPASAMACFVPPANCTGGYVNDYTDGCGGTCVPSASCAGDCRTKGCTGAATCQICWVDWACVPDGAVC